MRRGSRTVAANAGAGPVQPSIPGLARSDKQPRAVRRTEKVLQAHARAVLAQLGYASMETGQGRPHVECPTCQYSFTPTGWMGNTVGVPDLLVFRYVAAWPAVFAGVEMKGQGTEVTPEQRRLAENGRTVIAYSEAEAVRAVLAAEMAMDAYRFPAELRDFMERFLEENRGRI